jgi:Uncharacterised protein family (UPF0158)
MTVNSPSPVSAYKVTKALSDRSDERSFLDKSTGEIVHFPADVFAAAKGDEDPGGEDVERVKKILAAPEWVELPTKHEIHEWRIMSNFCRTIEDKVAREDLLRALRGRNTARTFGDALRRRKLEEGWSDFRSSAMRDLVREWFEAQGIEHGD